MMVPSNMLLSIFKPRIYLPTVVIVWGVVRTTHIHTRNHTAWSKAIYTHIMCRSPGRPDLFKTMPALWFFVS